MKVGQFAFVESTLHGQYAQLAGVITGIAKSRVYVRPIHRVFPMSISESKRGDAGGVVLDSARVDQLYESGEVPHGIEVVPSVAHILIEPEAIRRILTGQLTIEQYISWIAETAPTDAMVYPYTPSDGFLRDIARAIRLIEDDVAMHMEKYPSLDPATDPFAGYAPDAAGRKFFASKTILHCVDDFLVARLLSAQQTALGNHVRAMMFTGAGDRDSTAGTKQMFNMTLTNHSVSAHYLFSNARNNFLYPIFLPLING